MEAHDIRTEVRAQSPANVLIGLKCQQLQEIVFNNIPRDFDGP